MAKNIDIIEIPKKTRETDARNVLETYFKNGVLGHLEASNPFFEKANPFYFSIITFIPDFTRTLS